MTDQDTTVERREIAQALVQALDRRHELLDVVVQSEDYDAAIESIACALGTSAVAVREQSASPGQNLVLRPFAADKDRDIFAARTDDVRAAGDGSGAPAGDLDDEIRAAVGRVDAEEAAWLVAIDGSEKIGMVFGELAGGEVNVRIWIHPAFRKRGYGTATLRKSRSEMAAYFPAVPLVVRAPAAGS
jgi:GNAT superfamily N-acetyltransferase